MTLTEQLKKGKLKKGKYYVKTQEDNICELMFDDEGHWYDFGWDCWLGDDYVKEVLAPVPSYEEWQEEQKSLKVLAEAYCKEKEENQQLKKLLKRCRDFINYEVPDHCIDDVLLDKIDEMLK